MSTGKEIEFYVDSPMFVKNFFEFEVVGRNVSIPYFWFLIGERRSEWNIIMETDTSFPTKFSIANKIYLVQEGPSEILIYLILIGIVGLIIYREYKKY